jgi:hypothetical protein
MIDVSQILGSVPDWIKGIASVVVPLAATVAAWGPLGLPVPMTQAAHDAHHEHEAAIDFARSSVSFAQKAVERTADGTPENDEARAALEAAQARLDALEGG